MHVNLMVGMFISIRTHSESPQRDTVLNIVSYSPINAPMIVYIGQILLFVSILSTYFPISSIVSFTKPFCVVLW